jgi:hypothetical protein
VGTRANALPANLQSAPLAHRFLCWTLISCGGISPFLESARERFLAVPGLD